MRSACAVPQGILVATGVKRKAFFLAQIFFFFEEHAMLFTMNGEKEAYIYIVKGNFICCYL